jgi:ferrous iron transport protein B
LIDGVVEGLKSVIVFVPQIFLLFFFIVLLELSGYMARVVFILDKIMHKFGLHGRSCIPLLMGTGCNVPAILATRSIENKSSRMITMLINPLIPCTARIPIYVLLAGAFFPRIWFLVVAAMYLTGFVLALLMAKVFRKFLFKKEETPYVMELPPYRMPAAGSLWKHTIKKVGEFCKKIFTWVLLGCALIWLFSYFPRNEAATNVYHLKADSLQQEIRLCDAQISRLHQQRMQIYESDNNLGISFLQHNDRYISYFRSIKSAKEREISQLNYTIDTLQKGNSYLGRLGKTIEPVMKPLGFNWKICIAVLSGLMAKEVVVSSLAIMHNVPVADEGDVTKEEESRTQQSLREERNNTGDYAYNPPVALSLMIFILIYFPCIATIAVIKTESKWKWALFVVFYSIALAWIASFIVYQTAKLCVAYPFHALGIFGVALALLGFYIYRRVHKKLKIEN